MKREGEKKIRLPTLLEKFDCARVQRRHNGSHDRGLPRTALFPRGAAIGLRKGGRVIHPPFYPNAQKPFHVVSRLISSQRNAFSSLERKKRGDLNPDGWSLSREGRNLRASC